MILLDVNVLVHAHREDTERHTEYRSFLETALRGADAVGVSDLVLSGFLRVVTHPRVFNPPSPLATALAFVELIREHPNVVHVVPGNRHWPTFLQLCRTADTRGNLVSDAFHAALAIESGCEWVTTDRDYSRFPGLRWRHPLETRPGLKS